MTINPVCGPDRLKLGTFCTNGKGGASQSLAPEGDQMDWPLPLKVAQKTDAAGFEAAVPFARWRPLHRWPSSAPRRKCPGSVHLGRRDRSGDAPDWDFRHLACAVTLHPLVAAKQLATIDHGAALKEHDERYDHSEEDSSRSRGANRR